MTDDRKLTARLAAADLSLQDERMPPKAVHRVANRIARELDLQAGRRRFGWLPMATFVAGAVLVLVFLTWVNAPREAAESSDLPPAARPLARAVISGEDCRHASGESIDLRGACTVVTQSPAMRIHTVGEAHVSVAERVLRVHEGSALFDVDKVSGPPVRVVTPGGEIIVVGTRFRVAVTGQTGQIDLYEGRLEFHANDGTVTPIAAGERLAFGGVVAPRAAAATGSEPIVPATVDASAPPPPTVDVPATRHRSRAASVPPATPATARDAGALVEEVQRLRRRGEYERAATRLEEALREPWPARTAEVLSDELGRILSRRVDDPSRACEHWRAHLDRFPSTRYRSQIDASRLALGCP